MKKFASFLPFLLIVVGGGIAIGTVNAPGEWYASLHKPAFNPPNWVFGPVWTALYLIIAYVGWRLWKRGDRGLSMRLWVAQMVLNFMWSPVFFAAQRQRLALMIILGLLLTILLFIRSSWLSDRPSAMLFVLYAAWVGFASILNAAIVFLN